MIFAYAWANEQWKVPYNNGYQDRKWDNSLMSNGVVAVTVDQGRI